MWRALSHASVQLRNTQLLIDRDVLLLTLCIKNPSNTLSRERQVVLVLMADSEVFLYLFKEPSEELRTRALANWGLRAEGLCFEAS